MKTRVLILAAMSFTVIGFSQKSEIKSAEKALKGGDASAAKAAIESATALIGDADGKLKGYYHFVRGKIYTDLAKKGEASAFDQAIKSYNDVITVEESTGKAKYTEMARTNLSAISGELVNSAIADTKEKKFKEASDKLYLGYTLSKKDTVYLYYAASYAVQGNVYEDALKYYTELKDLGYDGGVVKYSAVNVETGEVEEMEKFQRDLMIKSGTYKDPKDEKTPSKKAEIIKNIALVYTQTGQNDKAIEAFKEARKSSPNDVNIILSEANLHFKLGDKEKFKELMAEAAEVAPDNPDLHYNIGVINMEQGNLMEARESYKKALAINPGYVNAQLNLSTTYVNEGNGLIDEMNSLGNSRKDIARYDEIKKQKDDLFKEGAVVLEDALKLNPDNQGILSQLKNIYGALGDNENFLRVKKLIGE